MTNLFLCFGFFYFLLVSFVGEINAALPESNGVYIVYMGASLTSDGAPRNDHAQLLTSLTKRKKNPVVHTYRNGFSGFAARLSEEEAKSIAQKPGVVSVFPDPILQIHTTRSWDFLKYQTALKIDSFASSPSQSPSITGDDTIIGILDTGIWPESASFSDEEMGPIPPYWKGKCMEGVDFNSSNCNRKIIGARYYIDPDSYDTPRDHSGHGTHVASTAAGSLVSGASYYGLANGTAQGGSPRSRIAVYRVCVNGGCSGAFILKAFDDAIADGVHILSLSLGGNPGKPNFQNDPVAIGAFHAVERGITVVCSAGNSGPSPASTVNVAPWIMTVAATTIDRDFQIDIVLGGNKVIKGGGINFFNMNKTTLYPLIDGRSAKLSSNVNDEDDAGNCLPGSLDSSKVKGKIVLREDNDNGGYEQRDKLDDLQDQGAIGMIVIDNFQRQVATKYVNFPVAAVSEDDGAQILSYINSNRSNAMATILPTVAVNNYKPAPSVAYFSSRGPIPGIQNLLKPDITAPGVSILAAWPSNDENAAVPGRDPPLFDVLSGTSMSCPHVSGLAATIRSQHPNWSPSAIKSAIMTTAIPTNNVHSFITTETGSKASPYDIGAGEISLSTPLQPGLVYETETSDYVKFLCNLGYNNDKIKSIASSLPKDFSCSNISVSFDDVSNMNYPSIAVSNLKKKNESKTANRTVTNVGEEDSVYMVLVDAPDGLSVEVVPSKLEFRKGVEKLSFQVIFTVGEDTTDDFFGSITWSNEKYRVRSPFVVSNASQNELS